MRVLACLTNEHDWRILLLAVVMCVFGSHVSVTLFRRALDEAGTTRAHWTFLCAVIAGASTWATHFIAMLGYQAPVKIGFDATLTIASVIVAVVLLIPSLLIACLPERRTAIVAGGGMIGLSVAAMHYLGMSAYQAEGVIRWLPEYVVSSVVASCAIGMLFVARMRSAPRSRWRVPLATALLVTTIVTLHFVGMAGFVLTPLPGLDPAANAEVFQAMASAILLVGMLVVGAGVSTHMIERRTYANSREELERIAMHDALTTLANRHSFTAALEAECESHRAGGPAFAVLMIDLDRFKPINDTLGHPTGDVVLRKMSARLCHAARADDLVARIGGDEFAIIVRRVSSALDAVAVAQRVVEILDRPVLVNGNVVEIGGSVGVALAPDHGSTSRKLVQHADVALYTAKGEGRNRYCLFEPHMQEAMQERRQLEHDLRRACVREDFEVHYQPVFDSASREVTGAEALLRWTCERRGPVSPAEFIPVAEELGLINRIGAAVLKQACRDAAAWDGSLDISVNISPVQLLDPRLVQTVMQALADSGLPVERLELEITETALINNDEVALRSLTRLRNLGVRISLDDFGTGYSSLSYLHRFPFSRLKIDRSFVERLPDDSDSQSIIKAITQLGGSMGLTITAEGIENEEQMDFVVGHGCGTLQGFLLGRPVPGDQFQDILARDGKGAAPLPGQAAA